MKEPRSRDAFSVAFSVFIGLIGGFVTFIILILLFSSTGLFGWTDGGETREIDRLENSTNITFILSVIIALVVGIFIVIRMNRTKQKGSDSSPLDTL